MCYQSKHLAWALAGQRGRGVHTKLSRPHHDSQLGVPIVLDDATVEFLGYSCLQPACHISDHDLIYAHSTIIHCQPTDHRPKRGNTVGHLDLEF